MLPLSHIDMLRRGSHRVSNEKFINAGDRAPWRMGGPSRQIILNPCQVRRLDGVRKGLCIMEYL